VLELVDDTTLNAFLSHCFAFMKTFAMMPSEIQLAIIKDMAWGKPVIVANSEVTGEFSRPFGLAARAGRIKDLSDAMVKLADGKADSSIPQS
jgi:hypothetical protein